MALITISRGTFAGGAKLAELLAKRLGYRIVSREALYQQVEEAYGLTTAQVVEIMEQAPTHLELAVERNQRLAIGKRRRRLLFALQASLCGLLQKDEAIYHGHAGHLLLPGISHVLRIRLIAPRDIRIALAMERENLTKLEATKKVDRVDSERTRWVQAFFGVNWADSAIFDMVLNLEQMTLEEAAEITAHTAKLSSFLPSEKSLKGMQDLCLSSHVLAQLASHPDTSHLEVEVGVDGGTVELLGFLSQEGRERAKKVLQEVPGVMKVETMEPGD
jgi:cytidylate kinase